MSTVPRNAESGNVRTPESAAAKIRRCLRECHEYLARIERQADPALAEAASAGLWDAIMDAPSYRSPGRRPVRRDSGLISRELAQSFAGGTWRDEAPREGADE
jgi:hypothetical protein